MTSDPKRLTVVGATDLERSLLQAARRERPSPELTARMAAGLGISAGVAVTAAAAPAAATATATATAAKTTLTSWLVAGALAAAVTTGIVVARRAPATEPAAPVKKAAVSAPQDDDDAASVAPAPAAARARRIDRARKRAAAVQPAAAAVQVPPQAHVHANDLRDQIALIDAARTAVKAGATERALVLLRRYETNYPGGAFRPEALALRIDALAEGGRAAEARPLAREFLARYPQSPLADRVARRAR